MKKVFINFSNHDSKDWSKAQIQAAEVWGPIVDMPFPKVDATASEREIGVLAESCVERIIAMQPAAVMCQGEFTLAFSVTEKLKACHIPVLAACADRRVETEPGENGQSVKKVYFEFVRFREF